MSDALVIFLIPIFFLLLERGSSKKSVGQKKFIELMDNHPDSTVTIARRLWGNNYILFVHGFYFELTCYSEINIPEKINKIDLR